MKEKRQPRRKDIKKELVTHQHLTGNLLMKIAEQEKQLLDYETRYNDTMNEYFDFFLTNLRNNLNVRVSNILPHIENAINEIKETNKMALDNNIKNTSQLLTNGTKTESTEKTN